MKKEFDVEIKVIAQDGRSSYTAVVTTLDPRHVWNKIRIGRNVIGPGNITTVHLMTEDRRPFRVGNEKDTVGWLRERFGGVK
jgi:hypothetical protein